MSLALNCFFCLIGALWNNKFLEYYFLRKPWKLLMTGTSHLCVTNFWYSDLNWIHYNKFAVCITMAEISLTLHIHSTIITIYENSTWITKLPCFNHSSSVFQPIILNIGCFKRQLKEVIQTRIYNLRKLVSHLKMQNFHKVPFVGNFFKLNMKMCPKLYKVNLFLQWRWTTFYESKFDFPKKLRDCRYLSG